MLRGAACRGNLCGLGYAALQKHLAGLPRQLTKDAARAHTLSELVGLAARIVCLVHKVPAHRIPDGADEPGYYHGTLVQISVIGAETRVVLRQRHDVPRAIDIERGVERHRLNPAIGYRTHAQLHLHALVDNLGESLLVECPDAGGRIKLVYVGGVVGTIGLGGDESRGGRLAPRYLGSPLGQLRHRYEPAGTYGGRVA